LFILPFLVVYEIGMLWQPLDVRNGADIWIREALHRSGFAFEWCLPLAVPLILLGWHLKVRDPWKCSRETLAGMFAESVVFAFALVLVGQLLHGIVPFQIESSEGTHSSITTLPERAIRFMGAGIYEELLFRLLMLPAIYGLFRLMRIPIRWAVVGSVVLTSLLFALAHHTGNEPLFLPSTFANAIGTVASDSALWFSFSFRYLAGGLFAWLFWYRGFGIATGTHVIYDLIVGVILGQLEH